jgi:ribosomal protein L9
MNERKSIITENVTSTVILDSTKKLYNTISSKDITKTLNIDIHKNIFKLYGIYRVIVFKGCFEICIEVI